jgi:hypothetical protein
VALTGGVRVEGLNDLTRNLAALGLELDDLKDAFGEIAAQGARLASSFAPRRTGALAGSVRGNRSKNKAVVAAGNARVPYARVINYGWPSRGIRASSFMQKADERMRPVALAELERQISSAIRRRGLG